MAKSVANVNIATDTFTGLVTLTNIIADTITNEAVTLSNTTPGATTSGNGNIIGILSATTLSANNIRGGSVVTSNTSTLHIGFANSTVSSNIVVNGYTANVTANNLNITSNCVVNSSSFTANVATIRLFGNTTIGSNSSHGVILSGSNTYVNSNILSVTSNTNFTGANNFFQNQISANTIIISSNTYVNSAVIFSGNTAALIHSSSNYAFPGDGTTSNILNSFVFSEFGSSKYTVSVTDNDNSNNRLITEISAVYDNGGTINSTEYGTIFTNTRFMTFTFSSNSTHVSLVGVSNSSVTNTKVTIVRTSFL